MIEAVENHMPQVIVIDEIGTELEAQAARTIAERGVQLIGTAHGNNLDNLMLNPTLSDLIGGIQSVTLGDEEARRRRSQKSVLERKAPPTFDVIVEIQDRERVLVHATWPRRSTRCCSASPSPPSSAGATRRASIARSRGPSRRAREAARRGDRFSGLTGAGAGAWGREPGWRGASTYRTGGYAGEDRLPSRPGFRPGAVRRLALGPRRARRARHRPRAALPGGRPTGALSVLPASDSPGQRSAGDRPSAPFVAGEIADRGPLERAEGAAAAAGRTSAPATPGSSSASRPGATRRPAR